jgi:hypothetical protein
LLLLFFVFTDRFLDALTFRTLFFLLALRAVLRRGDRSYTEAYCRYRTPNCGCASAGTRSR